MNFSFILLNEQRKYFRKLLMTDLDTAMNFSVFNYEIYIYKKLLSNKYVT